MKLNRIFAIALLLACMSRQGSASEMPWSQRTADAAILRWPDGRWVPAGQHWAWNYELGTLLEGMDAVWLNTADARYYNYIKASVDQFVEADGSIPTRKAEEYQLDNILLGRQLLLLYGVTQEKRYADAAQTLYEQLMHQPRNPAGGFWHKQRYPNQMWLDGLYMAEPFYAEYASRFNHPEGFKDITHQFALMDQHARDPKTGLLYHGWDESKRQRWADPVTGHSPNFWDRAIGWYAMALVDTLDSFPRTHPQRAELIAILNRLAKAVANYQDPKTGLWYEVVDKRSGKGNYLETSGSSMFVYALARGVRNGYLPASYLAVAKRGYKGLTSEFIKTDADGQANLDGTV